MDFKTATTNVSNINYKQKKKIDVSNWAQYGFKDGKIQCLNPPSELTDEEKNKEINDTLTRISRAIELNRYKYMMKYDELHGEGAYDRLYYSKPIYDNLDLELDSDLEEEEFNLEYQQNVYYD
jgi:hypothetical protein